ncbi:MAG: hypothetical protein ACYTG0_35460, partial [Planctomycetota bacterium]
MSRFRNRRFFRRRSGKGLKRVAKRSSGVERLEMRTAPGACLASMAIVGAAVAAGPAKREEPEEILVGPDNGQLDRDTTDPRLCSIVVDSGGGLSYGDGSLLEDGADVLFEPVEDQASGIGAIDPLDDPLATSSVPASSPAVASPPGSASSGSSSPGTIFPLSLNGPASSGAAASVGSTVFASGGQGIDASMAAALSFGAGSARAVSSTLDGDTSSGGAADVSSESNALEGIEFPSGGGFGDMELMGGGLDLGSDTCYVVDWNDGLTLSTGAVEYESEGDSVDLRAQVQGKAVDTYEWDLTEAPDVVDETGENTYHLQFIWDNVTESNSSSNEITLTVTYTDESTEELVFDFEVIDDGSASGSGGGGTPESVERPEVITPDLIGRGRDLFGGDGYAFEPATGALSTAHFVPSYDPGAPATGLSYHTESAVPKPIFIDHYELDPSRGIPDTVSAQL